MKKWYVIFLASLMLLLAACGSSEDNNSNSSTNNESKAEISAGEIYEKVMARFNELNSYSVDIVFNQKNSYESNSESFEMESDLNMKMDTVKEPSAMYVKADVTMNNPTAGMNQSLVTEGYLTPETFYMQNSYNNQWLKLTTDDFNEVFGETLGAVGPTKQLEKLKAFINDFKVEENDTQYVLTLNNATDAFKNYIVDLYKSSSEVELSEDDLNKMKKEMNFNKTNFVINIDKNTFDIVSWEMGVEFSGAATITMNSKMQMSNYSALGSIDVPQEVLNQAVEGVLQ